MTNDPQLLLFNGQMSGDTQDPTDQQWFVVVDKEILFESAYYSGREAFISLVAVHFAFNLRYHTSHSSMFKFLHDHVFGITANRKSYAYRKLQNRLLSKLTLVDGVHVYKKDAK